MEKIGEQVTFKEAMKAVNTALLNGAIKWWMEMPSGLRKNLINSANVVMNELRGSNGFGYLGNLGVSLVEDVPCPTCQAFGLASSPDYWGGQQGKGFIEVIPALAYVNPMGYLPKNVEPESVEAELMQARYVEGNQDLFQMRPDVSYDGDGLHKNLTIESVGRNICSGITFRVTTGKDFQLKILGV
jgi:hypothetical protein